MAAEHNKRIDIVQVSSALLTGCLLSMVPASLKFAATWRERHVWLTDDVVRYNYESLLGFASLALILIGLTVVWTGFRKRQRSAWIVMVLFAWTYYLPVYLMDGLLDLRRVGWPWWSALVREAMEGQLFARATLMSLVTFTIMITALFLPIKSFWTRS